MRRRGFTLTEMLVVIGIIVLVLSIVTPMASRAWKAADRSRTAASLSAIGTALESYKQDFGDYPRPTTPSTAFAVLGKALMSPGDAAKVCPAYLSSNSYNAGDAVSQGTNEYVAAQPVGPNQSPPAAPWVAFNTRDGVDGPGFRPRDGASPKPSYIRSEQFTAGGSRFFIAFRDKYGRAILYYPKMFPGNVRQPKGYIGDNDYTPTAKDHPLYNWRDNDKAMPLAAMAPMLGDLNANGQIDGTEQQVADLPYLLWSAGPDETYGPAPATATGDTMQKRVDRSDDITNFR